MAATQSRELETGPRAAEPDHQLPPGEGDGPATGLVTLLRELAEDTRTLVQQEIALAKMEARRTARRLVVDSVWIAAGVAALAVGGLCLVLALALALGALLDSYWLGTLITGGLLFLTGALLTWKGVHDLTSGGLTPTETVESLQADKEWARREMDDLKQGIRKERT